VAHAHLRHAWVDVQDGVEGGVRSPELPKASVGSPIPVASGLSDLLSTLLLRCGVPTREGKT
jgi:hypothetical protein